MSARDLPLFAVLSPEDAPPATTPSGDEEAAPPASAAAAVDPRHAADPAEVTLRGEWDHDADPRLLAVERAAEDYREARDRGDHAAAEACVVRLARVLAPGCEHFAAARHRAERLLAVCRVNPRAGYRELRRVVAEPGIGGWTAGGAG